MPIALVERAEHAAARVYGRSFGYSPRALLAPIAWPIFRPPPATSARHHRRPVVAAAVAAVDLRRAAELAPHHRHHVVCPCRGRAGPGSGWRCRGRRCGSCRFSVLKLLPCVSQPPIAERDAADAGLDQPAGGQELLDALVAVAGLRVFLASGRGPCGRRRRRPCRRPGR